MADDETKKEGGDAVPAQPILSPFMPKPGEVVPAGLVPANASLTPEKVQQVRELLGVDSVFIVVQKSKEARKCENPDCSKVHIGAIEIGMEGFPAIFGQTLVNFIARMQPPLPDQK